MRERFDIDTRSLLVVPKDLVTLFRDQGVAPRQGKVRLDHFTHQTIERDLRIPAELTANLTRVAQERFDLRGAEVAKIHAHDGATAAPVDPHLVDPAAAPFDIHAEDLPRSDHKV